MNTNNISTNKLKTDESLNESIDKIKNKFQYLIDNKEEIKKEKRALYKPILVT
jgi:hypothetical protein